MREELSQINLYFAEVHPPPRPNKMTGDWTQTSNQSKNGKWLANDD